MEWSPLWISLKVAGCATLLNFFLGVFIARCVVSMKHGKHLVDGLFSLPLVLPPTVVGFFLLTAFGRNSAIGGFLDSIGLRLVFTWQGAVIAATIVSFPLMYRTVRGAFEHVDAELVDVARLFGYGRAGCFFKVWIPLSWPSIASGLALAFARALGEFGATIMIAGNLPGKTQTMSVAVYTAVQGGDRERAYRLTLIMLAVSFAALAVMNYLTEKQYRRE